MPAAPPAPFELDARLAADTHVVGDLALSRILLMDDARFPWLILVPRRSGLRELIDLPRELQHALLDEIGRCADALRSIDRPHKLNIAALGNVVAQLHVHVIARHTSDAAWPRPVWCDASPRPSYATDALSSRLSTLRGSLRLDTQ